MNLSDKAKQIIATIAPTLGTALGGPLGGLAGAVLSKALGNNDDKAIDAAIAKGDPETLLKLKQAENDLLVRMKELDISEEKLTFDDVANARAREIAVKDNTPRNLAYLIVTITGVLEGYALLHGLPRDIDQVIVGRVLGTLDTATMLVLGYYFGTTFSSKKKDDTIAAIAQQP
jgi:hypothetical protein